MPITFKAGNPESKTFTVPAGDYTLRVIEAKEDTSKSGNDMIKLSLAVVKEDGTNGVRLFDYLVFTEASRWKVDAFLQACGKHPGEGKSLDLDCDAMIGWEAEATLAIDKHEGKESNKVAAYKSDSF
jgi:hypothetical protein